MKVNFKKIIKIFFIFILVFFWLFSSWPQISNFPPKIQEAHASVAAPTLHAFGVIAAVASGGSANLTVTLPTHSKNDVILLEVVIRSTAVTASVTGYTQIATVDRGSSARYYWFYKRDGGSESNPVVAKSGTSGDTYAVAVTYSGAATAGDPWEVKGTPQTSATADPFVLTGITALSANSLIVAAVTGEDNNSSAVTTTGTNPSAYTEHDAESGTGSDGVVTICEGAQTTAGATGNVSVDWDVAIPVGEGGILLALKAADNPIFVAAGAVAYGTTAITPLLPAGIQADDILLLFLETSNEAISIDNANGGIWTEVSNSPQGLGAGANTTSTRLTVFWSRYNGAQTAPVTSDSGSNQLGRMIAIRGAVDTGDPTDVTAGGTDATANTSASIPGATTFVNNDLIVAAIATALPAANGTANFSAETNSNLYNIVERTDNTRTAGIGGGLAVATGSQASAGACGNTAVTLASSSVKVMMSIAIKPPSSSIAPPADVTATDRTYTDKVTVTWTKSSGAAGYKVYEGSNLLDTLGDEATYNDSAAPAPTITPGTASASDGTAANYVSLSLSGQSADDGQSRTYRVAAFSGSEVSDASAADTGYRGAGALAYQWQRSSADSDASYSNIDNATDASYNDTDAPADGSGRYYKCILNATGASQQISTVDRGFKQIISISLEPGSGTVAYGVVATSKDTTATGVNQTQTVRNTGNVAEDFDIKGQNSANWTLSASGPGDAIYKHEWCTQTCDSTPVWNAFTTSYAGNYMATNIASNNTKDFDLRITVPSANPGISQQNVAVSIQATQH